MTAIILIAQATVLKFEELIANSSIKVFQLAQTTIKRKVISFQPLIDYPMSQILGGGSKKEGLKTFTRFEQKWVLPRPMILVAAHIGFF